MLILDSQDLHNIIGFPNLPKRVKNRNYFHKIQKFYDKNQQDKNWSPNLTCVIRKRYKNNLALVYTKKRHFFVHFLSSRKQLLCIDLGECKVGSNSQQTFMYRFPPLFTENWIYFLIFLIIKIPDNVINILLKMRKGFTMQTNKQNVQTEIFLKMYKKKVLSLSRLGLGVRVTKHLL